MTPRQKERTSIVVLEATRPPDGTTRYIDQVVTFADSDIVFKYLSLRTLLSRRLDVVHFHWPEVLLRGSNFAVRTLRLGAFVALIVLLRIRRVAVVRTLHNLKPHEQGSRIEARLLSVLDGMTTLFVTINSVTVAPGASVHIPHGHYRDRFAGFQRAEVVPGRVVHAGLVRPYKGIEGLVEVAAGLAPEGVELRIVGKPTAELRRVIGEAVAAHSNISARLEFVSDADLVSEITSAELVCLPYSEMHNSGMVLVALSLDRPVLVPETGTTNALAREVGEGWVNRFADGLTEQALLDALRQARLTLPDSHPNLQNRDWQAVGRMYSSAFRRALAARRGRRLAQNGELGCQ